jgi:hypothetical protein
VKQLKVIRIETALFNRLDKEPDSQRKVLIWRQIESRAKSGKRLGRRVAHPLDTHGYIEIGPAALFTVLQEL